MNQVTMTDADERFATRLSEELGPVLGPSIRVERIHIDGDGPVTVIVTCRFEGSVRELAGHGPTLLDAVRDVVRGAAELRLTEAWRVLMART